MSNPAVTTRIEQDFMQAYTNEADALFRFVFFRTRERESALDIVQETYLKTWRYLAEGNPVQELRALLFKTARNLIIDSGRSAAVRKERSLDAFLDEGGDVADETAQFTYDPLDLERAVALLCDLEPPEYREVIQLRFIEELSPSEIAQILGVSENVVSVRINRAIKKLNAQFSIKI